MYKSSFAVTNGAPCDSQDNQEEIRGKCYQQVTGMHGLQVVNGAFIGPNPP